MAFPSPPVGSFLGRRLGGVCGLGGGESRCAGCGGGDEPVAALSPRPLTPSPAPALAPAAFPPLSWAESAAALIDPSPAPTSAPATSPLLGRIELAAAPVDSLPPPTSSPAASPPLGRAESAAASVDAPPLGQPKLPAAVSASPATRPAPS